MAEPPLDSTSSLAAPQTQGSASPIPHTAALEDESLFTNTDSAGGMFGATTGTYLAQQGDELSEDVLTNNSATSLSQLETETASLSLVSESQNLRSEKSFAANANENSIDVSASPLQEASTTTTATPLETTTTSVPSTSKVAASAASTSKTTKSAKQEYLEENYIKNYFEDSEEYKLFRESVALRKVSTHVPSNKNWSYYSYGPKSEVPLICIPGLSGAADCFYLQMLSLSAKGYHVISVNLPPIYTHEEFVLAFDCFLTAINVKKCHLLGTGLGGFLAQLFIEAKPKLVESLILCNSFLDTTEYHNSAPCMDMFQLMPGFILKKLILNSYPQTAVELMVCRSIDFMVDKLEALTQKEISSRLMLNCILRKIKKLPLAEEKITIIDCLDDHNSNQATKDRLYDAYPKAKMAFLKTGGNFPYLSRSDEFNMYLQVHLRMTSKPSSSSQHTENAEEQSTTSSTPSAQ